ncbi:hypothetical protein CQW23_26303 [Capsicum baccatum]|uniref:Uncharacterized protein n=1 Tax=Capsicum baccatum TaxID=33114 RepID=A0A2G2VNI0_CAPBA|nr:hypothetical protein CQW23_26303 [Capsicum baccatum]
MSSQILHPNAFWGEPASSSFEWHFTSNHNSSADSSTSVGSDLYLVSPKLHPGHGYITQESGPCLSPSVADHPLGQATDHCLGKLLPYQLSNQTRAPPRVDSSFSYSVYGVLAAVSSCCFPRAGSYALLTHPPLEIPFPVFPIRLACVKHAASVYPEPGSNSP